MSSKNSAKRGIYVLMGIVCVILFIILINTFVQNENYDNANVQGTYNGFASFDNNPDFSMSLDFDGKGTINGIIQPFNATIEQATYVVINYGVSISFVLNESTFTFVGDASQDYSYIQGTARYMYDIHNGTYVNGTFFIQK
jgi:hypothetical protein